jgi:outer membrane protein OmpA-like peptidoglycan-associated protein
VQTEFLKVPNQEIDETGAWLSIGDLMSGLLMIFSLLLIVALLQLTEAAEKEKESRIVIIQTLQKTLSDEGINAEINPVTGDISILDSLLFDQASYTLKSKGKNFLHKFVPVYSKAIFSERKISDEIAYVVIEGHTSSLGGYDQNMRLSLMRANSVSEEVSKMNFPMKVTFQSKVLTAGRGEIEAKQGFDDPADRSVLFRFQFKSERFLHWFNKQREQL